MRSSPSPSTSSSPHPHPPLHSALVFSLCLNILFVCRKCLPSQFPPVTHAKTINLGRCAVVDWNGTKRREKRNRPDVDLLSFKWSPIEVKQSEVSVLIFSSICHSAKHQHYLSAKREKVLQVQVLCSTKGLFVWKHFLFLHLYWKSNYIWNCEWVVREISKRIFFSPSVFLMSRVIKCCREKTEKKHTGRERFACVPLNVWNFWLNFTIINVKKRISRSSNSNVLNITCFLLG